MPVCLNCGKEIALPFHESHPNNARFKGRKYCNQECYRLFRLSLRELKPCEQCGNPIPRKESIHWYAKRKFCSIQCSNRSRIRETVDIRSCKHCNSTFVWIGRKSRSLFCSKSCHNQFNKERDEKLIRYCLGCQKQIQFPYKGKGRYTRLIARKYCSDECRWPNRGNARFPDARGYICVAVSPRRFRYEHRVLAERLLQRSLEKGEIVHHIDCKPGNNAPSNLLVCAETVHRLIHEEMGRRYIQERGGVLPDDLLALGIWLGDKQAA